jgi:glycosyltransferase involved in cell wall biosynthesis
LFLKPSIDRGTKGLNTKKLSIIVPVFNEEDSIPTLVKRISNSVVGLVEWEIIFVDNCSTDNTNSVIRGLLLSEPRIKYIRFTRNFGPDVEASLDAGYRNSSGDAAIVIYSDLQDPPELIPDFIDKWNQGFDVVYGIQTRRLGEKAWRRVAVKLFYRIFRSLSDSPTMTDSGDFKLVSRRVIDQLIEMPERGRFSRGLIAWLGFPSIGIPYVREPRHSGKSKARIFSIIRTAFTAITSFSLKPLRILTGFGAIVTLSSLLFIIALAIGAIFGNPQPGITTVASISLLTLGLTMGALGLIGEYLGRIQIEVKGRPLYVIDEKINLK